MKQCLHCGAAYRTTHSHCSACGLTCKTIDGFLSYAPELAHEGGGFKASYFSDLAQREEGNFWFQARNALIQWVLEKHCPSLNTYLEIGCGTGYVLSGIAKQFPTAVLNASEVFTAGLHFAAQRVPSANFMQMDARKIPFVDEFDVIGAFDVIEHIAEDSVVLAETYKALKPEGHLLLTVPQHMWLWSPSDTYAKHERRYSAREIHQKIKAAGFSLKYSTSFVSLLLPLMLASRVLSRRKQEDFDPKEEFNLSAGMQTALSKVMAIERNLIKLGINFPLGGSRLILAKKTATR